MTIRLYNKGMKDITKKIIIGHVGNSKGYESIHSALYTQFQSRNRKRRLATYGYNFLESFAIVMMFAIALIALVIF